MMDPERGPAQEPRHRGARARIVLLFLAAAVFNFLTAGVLFFGFLALWGLVPAPWLRLSSSAPVILAAFTLAVAGSGILYRRVVKLYLKRTGRNPDHPLTKS